MARTIPVSITVWHDRTDPENDGLAYRIRYHDGSDVTGPLDVMHAEYWYLQELAQANYLDITETAAALLPAGCTVAWKNSRDDVEVLVGVVTVPTGVTP